MAVRGEPRSGGEPSPSMIEIAVRGEPRSGGEPSPSMIEIGAGRLTDLAALAALALAWEIVGRLDVSMFVPPLSTVTAAWWRLVVDGTLLRAASSSLVSLVEGFVAAAVFMFSFFVIVVNTTTGVRGTERSLVEMARSFGAGEGDLFGRIYLPSALPAIMLGLRLGAVQAVKGMVVGEMLISLVGLGERLIYYGNTFLITDLYAVILTVLVLALAVSQLAQSLDRALIRWR